MKLKIRYIFFIIIIFSITAFSHETHTNKNEKPGQVQKNEQINKNETHEQKSKQGNNFQTKTQKQNTIEIKKIISKTGRIAGFVAFILFCFVFFIGGSNRLWDKFFGLNNVLRYHKYFAVTAMGILLLHPMGFLIIKLYSFADFKNFGLLAGIIAADVFLLIVITSLLYKYMNYYIWIWIHRLSALAIVAGAYHIFNYGFWIHKYSVLKILVYFSLFVAATGLVIKIYLLIKTPRYKSKVLSVHQETHDTYTVVVQKPKNFNYKPGQFCFISFNKKYLKKPHPISFSSSPEQNEIKFTIKENRKFSKSIKNVKPDDIIKIDGPYGIFTYNYHNSVFIAGGVGITPFASILNYEKTFNTHSEIKLFYGCRKKGEIIFKENLKNLNKNTENFNLSVVLSHEQSENYEHGFINEVFLKKHVDFKEDFYICGPPALLKSVKKVLKKNNVPSKKIFVEKFFF